MTLDSESARIDSILRGRQNWTIARGALGAVFLAANAAYAFDFIEVEHKSGWLHVSSSFGMFGGALAVVASIASYFSIQDARNKLK